MLHVKFGRLNSSTTFQKYCTLIHVFLEYYGTVTYDVERVVFPSKQQNLLFLQFLYFSLHSRVTLGVPSRVTGPRRMSGLSLVLSSFRVSVLGRQFQSYYLSWITNEGTFLLYGGTFCHSGEVQFLKELSNTREDPRNIVVSTSTISLIPSENFTYCPYAANKIEFGTSCMYGCECLSGRGRAMSIFPRVPYPLHRFRRRHRRTCTQGKERH